MVYTPESAGIKAGALTANSTARATRSICFCIAHALASGTIAAGSPPERTMPHVLKRKEYERRIDALHLELIELQRWVALRGRRLCVLFEGRDAAGKGGTIKAITEKLETRHYRIVALPRPGEAERGQWYFQRYAAHLPRAGEIVLFDRSWYNRAVVEPALGFCTRAQYRRFLDDCPVFEELLVRDGIILLKYWLAVDQAEQEQRFRARADDPVKRWKLSPVDLASRRKYAEFGRLRDAMLARTHRPGAPWFVVDFNDQRQGRLTLIRHLLDQLPDRLMPAPRVRLPALRHAPLRERLADPSLLLPAWPPD